MLSRTSTGLLYEHSFAGDPDGDPSADFAPFTGTFAGFAQIASGRLRLTGGGVENRLRIVAAGSALDAAFVQAIGRQTEDASADTGGLMVKESSGGATGFGYQVDLRGGKTRAHRFDGTYALLQETALAGPALNADAVHQLFAADNVQNAWLGSTLRHELTDGGHVAAGYVALRTSDASSTMEYASVAVCTHHQITVTGLLTGQQIRVGDRTATESGGTATLSLGGLELPQALLEVLSPIGSVVDRYEGEIWGGDVFAFALPVLAHWELTLHDGDNQPMLGDPSFSTDPGHARPYLDWPRDAVGSAVDFFAGKAKVGQFNVLLLDKRSDPTNQATGQVTALLGPYQGLNGLRARLTFTDADANGTVAIDGPISTPRMHSSYAGYELAIRDENIRTRKVKAFDRTGMVSVFPRGPLAAFGLLPSGQYAFPAAAVFTGTFDLDAGGQQGKVWASAGQSRHSRVLTAAMAEAARFTWDESVQANVLEHCTVRWRETGSSDPWTELVRMPAYRAENTLRDRFGRRVHTQYIENELFETRVDSFKIHDAGGAEREYRDLSIIRGIRLRTGGGSLPADGQDVELQVVYTGPATEAYPFLWEGTKGEFLAAAYSGDFSRDPLNVRYDADALAAFNMRCVARITKPTDDLLGFLEKEWYAPLAAAPTLNAEGEISPVRYILPDENTDLLTLDDANVAPDPDFSHPDTAVLNKVSVAYPRLIPVDDRDDPTGAFSDGAGMYARAVTVTWEEDVSGPSHQRFGEQVLEIKSELMCALGKPDGTAAAGEATREDGHLLAVERGEQAKDRYLYGAAVFPLRVLRSQLGATREGDWVEVGVSWLPDYISELRGMNRVAQIVGIEHLDLVTSVLSLEDGGDALAPLAQPTVGVAVENADGGVTLPITAVVADTEALMEYAISAAQPPHDSNLWTPAGRTDVAASLKTPALPSGASVWVGARSFAAGRRPSLRTTPQQVVLSEIPRVTDVRVRVNEDTGAVTVTWTPNAFTLGAKVYYIAQATEDEDEPTDFLEVDASLGTVTLPDAALIGQRITVDVEGYEGWTGAAVSGAAGPKVRAHGGLGHGPVIKALTLTHPVTGTLLVEVEASVSVAEVRVWLKKGSAPTDGGEPDDLYLAVTRKPDSAGLVTATKPVTDGTWHALVRAYEDINSPIYAETSDTIVVSGVGGEGGGSITVIPGVPELSLGPMSGGNRTVSAQWLNTSGALDIEVSFEGTVSATETEPAGSDFTSHDFAIGESTIARARYVDGLGGEGPWSGYSNEILVEAP